MEKTECTVESHKMYFLSKNAVVNIDHGLLQDGVKAAPFPTRSASPVICPNCHRIIDPDTFEGTDFVGNK